MGAEPSHKMSAISKSASYGPFNEIEMDISWLFNNKQLKFKFIYVDKHPKMMVFETLPQYGNHAVVCIDLVYEQNELHQDKPFNVVRFKSQTWTQVQRTMTEEGAQTYNLTKPLGTILTWCCQYQDDNPFYSKSTNNCRKFMMELCGEIEVTFPDKMFMEDQWYRWNAATKSSKNSASLLG